MRRSASPGVCGEKKTPPNRLYHKLKVKSNWRLEYVSEEVFKRSFFLRLLLAIAEEMRSKSESHSTEKLAYSKSIQRKKFHMPGLPGRRGWGARVEFWEILEKVAWTCIQGKNLHIWKNLGNSGRVARDRPAIPLLLYHKGLDLSIP